MMRRNHSIIRNSKSWVLSILLMATTLLSMVPSASQVVSATPIEATIVLDPTTAPMLIGTSQVLNDGPGDQLDVDVNCDLAAYLDIDFFIGAQWIRYFDFTTSTHHQVPNNGTGQHPDVFGSTVTFTEARVGGGAVVVLFDTVSQTRTEVPGSSNSVSSLGGNLVAYQNHNFNNDPSESEIGVYDRSTSTVTRLTNDLFYDAVPAVSPTGNAIVWVKCQDGQAGCDVYSAIQTAPGTFTTMALTASAGVEQAADTNGEIAVYVLNKDGDNDIYFQPVGGGVETRLSIPGDQRHPSISGNLIIFISFMEARQYDVFAYDLTSAKLYRVTNTPVNEVLPRVSLCNGVGRIVYEAPASDFNAFAFTFTPPSATENQIEDLIELVESFNLPNGTENSLITKLDDALTALEASDTATACVQLSSFISECQAQSGKKLTADQANQLINSATQIKTELGCVS